MRRSRQNTGFNPRPPSLTGEQATITRAMRSDWFQSTPAIADGRTSAWRPVHPTKRCFNPRPPSLTGERHLFVTIDCIYLFQSTPAIADGRTRA